jgi:septal ring factor EnvC (AmiA/AmiB activator)
VERERTLEQRAEDLATQERELEEQRAELQTTLRDLAARTAALAAVERSASAERERIETAAADLAERQQRVAAMVAQFSEPAQSTALPEAVTIVPRSAASSPLIDRPDAARNIEALEALVERHAGDFPDRADEWRLYVAYLRDFADGEGHLPDTFDGLVADVFGDLLQADRRV